MSATAALWCVGLVVICMMTVVKARWGLTLYLYTFFAFPPMWWWGKGLPDLRYSLLSGVMFLGSVCLHTTLGNLGANIEAHLAVIDRAAEEGIFNMN